MLGVFIKNYLSSDFKPISRYISPSGAEAAEETLMLALRTSDGLDIAEYNKTFGGKNICKECENIYNYASIRTDKCKFIDTKTFCSACSSQCYNKDMKEKIKNIMHFSGKRMLFHHPIIALKHVIVMIKHNFNKDKKINFKGII